METTLEAPVLLKSRTDDEVQVLQDYAEFWKIPYTSDTSPRENQVLVSSGNIPRSGKETGTTIIFPSGPEDARRIAEHYNLEVKEKATLLRLPVSSGVSVAIRTTVNEFSGSEIGSVISDAAGTPVLSRIHGTRTHLSSVNLVSEYERLVIRGLEEVPSRKFRLLTKFPSSYRLIPSFIRNRAFRAPRSALELTEDKLSPVECLRVIFLASLVASTGYAIPHIAFWRRGKSYVLAITHDVETKHGFEDGTGRLADVESNLGVRSTWNVPSERYPLSQKRLVSLAQAGEVGGHDTKHDGGLLFESPENKIGRVKRCKARLESLSGSEVRGFRSPLLQHGRDIIDALGKAGYQYDSSVPSWEPLSPSSLRPHGIGTVFPLFISGMLEIPVSLPQDHQLIRVSGLSVSESIQELFRVSGWVRGIGGACVLLVHPDYEFAESEHIEEYQRLLERFKSDPDCEILTLGELAQWWTHRAKSNVEIHNGELSISYANNDREDNLDLLLVTGYGPDGFQVTHLSDVEVAPIAYGKSREEEIC